MPCRHRPTSALPARLMAPVLPAILATALVMGWAGSARGQQTGPATEQEARAQLQTDLDSMQGQIMRWHDDRLVIALRNANTEEVRERLNQWTRSMKNQYRSAFRGSDPRESMIKVWTLSAQVDWYLSEEGTNLFGPAQKDMVEKSKAILFMIEELARNYLPNDAYETARDHIRNHVQSTPLRAGLDRAGLLTVLDDTWSGVLSVGGGALRRVTDIPLMPTRSLGAEGFGRMSESIDMFRMSMEELPDELRHQIERLITDLADHETSASLLLADVLIALERVNEILDGSSALTQDVEQTLITSEQPLTLARDITESVEKAAAESRLLVDAVSALLAQLEAQDDPAGATQARPFDVREYTSAALALDQGALSVKDMLEVIQEIIREADSEEPSERPFDIRDYEAAARAIESASAEIGAIVADARAMLESRELAENAEPVVLMVDQSLASATERLESLVDHIAWRLAQIVLLIFGLAAALLLLRALLPRRLAPENR